LEANQTTRGHVSNYNATHKIYEFYVNADQLSLNEPSDLLVEITPCNGKVNLYISDDQSKLFATDSQVNGYIDQ
jgi:hypothetical protein